MDFPTLDALRAALQDYNLMAVARACNVHHNTLYRFMHGISIPRYAVLIKLIAYLREKQRGGAHGNDR